METSGGGPRREPGREEVFVLPIRRLIGGFSDAGALDDRDAVAALAQLTETSATALDVGRASVWRFDVERSKLVCLDLYLRPANEHSSEIDLRRTATPIYFDAVEREGVVAVDDAFADARAAEFIEWYFRPNGIGAMLDVPIWIGGELVGVICNEHLGGPRRWTELERIVAGVFADMAAMILAAKERQERDRALLDAVLAAAPVGLAFFDAELRYVRINPWLARLNGVPVESTLGRRPSEVVPAAAGGAAFERSIAEVFRTGRPSEPFERCVQAGNDTRFFVVSFYPVVEGGRVTHAGCCVVETTTIRRGARAVIEREQAALRDAEANIRAKDEFLAMLGHELRNPLAPIVTALHLMEPLGDTASTERAVLERQVALLARLVDDLLDVSRIARGKLELRVSPCDLEAVVRKGLETAAPQIQRRRHALITDVAAGLAVDGDPHRLAQVVANLLTNAAKYTPDGGRITVRGLADGDQVVLSVSDDGIGIPAEISANLFDAFVQGKNGADRTEGGLGLGLAIVRGIVAAHGGTVEAYSSGAQQGSEIVVRLKRATSRPPTRPQSSSIVAPPPSRRSRILVVDDNEDAATLLRESLARLGHRVELAFDGRSALLKAAAFKPEAALLDIGMPVMDGLELSKRLRDLPGLTGIKLVAITGYGSPGDKEKSRSAGFDAHLVKPVDLGLLGLELARLLGEPEA